jgi:hypothetical protein
MTPQTTKGSSEPDSAAQVEEIEITERMAKIGAELISNHFGDVVSPGSSLVEGLACEAYRAMSELHQTESNRRLK